MKTIAKYLITALLCAAGASWAADWNAPTITTPYVNYTDGMKARDVDSARLFDPAYTSPTNVPQYAIRWNGAQNRLERWSGSAWGPLVLGITGGGCGANSASSCRTALGLAIGTNVQAYDADLTAVAGLNSTGLAARTATNTWAQRTLTASGTGLSINNGNGASGNPTFSLSANLQSLSGNTVLAPPLKVGSGSTPVSWGAQIDSIQVGMTGAFSANSAGAIAYMTNNMYWDGADWMTMTDGASGKLVILGDGVLRYEAAASGTAGTEANEITLFRVASNGKITSNAPCAGGYTRTAPGFCRRDYPSTATVNLARDSCQSLTFPSGASAILISVSLEVRSANTVANRGTQATLTDDSSCDSGGLVRQVSVSAREQVASGTGQPLAGTDGTMIVPASSAMRIRMQDDGGNQGVGSYSILGYWDN